PRPLLDGRTSELLHRASRRGDAGSRGARRAEPAVGARRASPVEPATAPLEVWLRVGPALRARVEERTPRPTSSWGTGSAPAGLQALMTVATPKTPCRAYSRGSSSI